MKETYSVEIKHNDYNDDLFNGTLAEFTDNTTLITSAIHDMRAAFNNLCDIIHAANGIDEANAEMLRALISEIDDYSY